MTITMAKKATDMFSGEAYNCGNVVIVVHRREDGKVYYHFQGWNDNYITRGQLRQVAESIFDEQMSREGVTKIDANELPAALPFCNPADLN